MPTQVHYEEIRCKSAMNRVSGMGFRWSLNPYRGCVHGCHYCFARRFHSYYDLDPGKDFTSVIFVKVNVPEVLGGELSSASWRREQVSVGTATDPYQPIEGKYRLTRRCLEAFADWRTPINLVTKGTMVVQDTDILQELTLKTQSSVCFSVTTVDVDLARQLEPGTPPPEKRLLAMERLVQAGVNAGVALAPVIPGITDGSENLTEVVREAVHRGARFLWASMLYLKPGTKEHFLDFLEREYPALPLEYRRLYPDAYSPKSVQQQMAHRVRHLKQTHGLSGDAASSGEGPEGPRQLALPLG